MSQHHHMLLKLVLFLMSGISANVLTFPSSSDGPQLNVNETYIINAGEQLLLECRGKHNVSWEHHHTSPIDGEDYWSIGWLCSRDGDWEFCSSFMIDDTTDFETGLYTCVYQNDKHSKAETMVYVYNSTSSEVIVGTDHISETVGGKLVLGCLPTLPNITLTLYKDGIDVMNVFTWEPKYGFTKNNTAVADSGWYDCKATDYNSNLLIHVEIQASTQLYPNIEETCETMEYMVGMEFQLICWVNRDTDGIEFNWTLPNNKAMYTKKLNMLNDSSDRLESMIFMENPAVEDSGEYKCSVEGAHVTTGLPGRKNITFKDPCTFNEYVQLENSLNEITRNVGGNFSWRVEIKSFPARTILTYQRNNITLRRVKENCKKSEIFYIRNLTNHDFGNLTLQVQTQGNQSYCTRGRTFKTAVNTTWVFLSVKSHPIIESLSAPSAIVAEGEEVVVMATCIVIAFPEPIINWYFQQGIHVHMDIGGNKTKVAPGNKWIATFEYSSNTSGNLRCEANNSLGNESESLFVNITVEEAVEFINGNISSESEVNVKWNDDQIIDCSVKGHPKPNIYWYKDDILINKTQLEVIGLPDADNPQQLELQGVHNVHKGIYKCVANNTKNEINRTIEINVLENVIIKENVVWTPGRRAGLAIVFVLIVIMILIIIRLFKKVRKEKEYKASMKQTRAYLFQQGNPEAINNDLTADEQAQFLPYDISWEIPRKDITQGQILGSGAFGQVLKALVKGLEEDGSSKTVALKMVKSTEDHSQVRALALELKIMIHLGKHLNIVNLVGAHTADIDRGELWIIVEFCKYGNLLVYMHKHQRVFINQIDPITDDINGSIIGSSSAGSPSVTEGLSGPSSGSMSPRSCMGNPGYGLIVTEPSGTVKDITMEKEIQKTPVSPINGRRISSDPLLEGQPSQLKIINSDMSSTSYNRCVSNTAASPMSDIGLDTGGNPLFQDFGGNIPGKDGPFTTSDLVCWSWQVSQGMEYLAKRKVLHGDLAARNLLLTYNNVVKISDFGLSRDVYKKDVYMKKGDDLMPIKWMAIESIRDRIFSVQSDVWAYGVTLWEIFSLGSTPYPGTEVTPDFISLLERGKRMEQPRYGNRELYDIVLSCWEADPRQRPTFSQLTELVGELLNPDKKGVYMKMNDVYLQMNKEFFSERTDYLQMLASPDFTNNRQSTISLSPSTDQMVNNEYMKMGSNTEAAISNPGYFPMGSVRDSAAAVDNEQDIFSPRQPDENEQKFFANEEDEDNTEKSVENEWEIVDKEHEYVNLPKKKKDLIDF